MPAILLERLPLPSLQTYVTISVIFLASALLYTHHAVLTAESAAALQETVSASTPLEEQTSTLKQLFMSQPEVVNPYPAVNRESADNPEPAVNREAADNNPGPAFNREAVNPAFDPKAAVNHDPGEDGVDAELLAMLNEEGSVNLTLPYDTYEMNFLWVLTSEAWCVWTLVNTVYCILILVGKLIQAIIFGELRVSEQQHLKDKFWNFVFYKFIFIFGVMNVQTMEEVVLWVAWFTCLGFLHLLVQLCKDRFEYLSFSPTTPGSAHAKLLGLLLVLWGCSGALFGLCVAAGFKFGPTIFAFMAAECVLLALKAFYVFVRYVIHLRDLSLESVWENRSVLVYYSELIFELSSLSVDFAHHLHMLLWGNIFLSMASLVICMQLRYLFYETQRRFKRHKNYLRVVKNMQARFPMATQEELELNADECAICWESMEAARKLPCGHLFHNSCLRSWLEQDTSCPTCRMTLSERPDNQTTDNNPADPATPNNPNMAEAAAAGNQGTTNHFFHFDGSRYVSWLPSFSVEVTHTNLLPGQQFRLQTSQLDSMLRQVQMMFPNFPSQIILDDLRVTRSVEVTIDNILENRLQPSRTIDLAAYREDYWENNPNVQQQQQPQQQQPQQQQQQQQQQQPQEFELPTTVSRTAQMALRAAMADINNSPTAERTETETTRLSATVSSFNTAPVTSQTSEPSATDVSPNSGESELAGSQFQAQGGRFSKSASERMSMLKQRKDALLEQARRRYLSHHSEAVGETGASTSSQRGSDDDRTRRRELMLQATQRRLNNP